MRATRGRAHAHVPARRRGEAPLRAHALVIYIALYLPYISCLLLYSLLLSYFSHDTHVYALAVSWRGGCVVRVRIYISSVYIFISLYIFPHNAIP